MLHVIHVTCLPRRNRPAIASSPASVLDLAWVERMVPGFPPRSWSQRRSRRSTGAEALAEDPSTKGGDPSPSDPRGSIRAKMRLADFLVTRFTTRPPGARSLLPTAWGLIPAQPAWVGIVATPENRAAKVHPRPSRTSATGLLLKGLLRGRVFLRVAGARLLPGEADLSQDTTQRAWVHGLAETAARRSALGPHAWA
jgi:hypothetical protein